MALENNYIEEITPKKSLFSLNLKDVFESKDLLFLFVKRDFVAVYKQTILGPLWFFIEPALTTIVFTVIFGTIAGISTGNIPPILFYLAGLTCWNYFADSFKKTSNTFIENQHIFGKVYFPRLITPLSIVISSLIKFGIQFLLFLSFYFYFYLFTDSGLEPNMTLLLFPYLIILIGLLGLGFGLIISSITTKYRDMRFLIQFGIQLWMYATPIIYPLNVIEGNLRTVVLINPVTSIVEAFKYGFFGEGEFNILYLAYSSLFALIILLFGVVIFNKTEQNFMDTI